MLLRGACLESALAEQQRASARDRAESGIYLMFLSGSHAIIFRTAENLRAGFLPTREALVDRTGTAFPREEAEQGGTGQGGWKKRDGLCGLWIGIGRCLSELPTGKIR